MNKRKSADLSCVAFEAEKAAEENSHSCTPGTVSCFASLSLSLACHVTVLFACLLASLLSLLLATTPSLHKTRGLAGLQKPIGRQGRTPDVSAKNKKGSHLTYTYKDTATKEKLHLGINCIVALFIG